MGWGERNLKGKERCQGLWPTGIWHGRLDWMAAGDIYRIRKKQILEVGTEMGIPIQNILIWDDSEISEWRWLSHSPQDKSEGGLSPLGGTEWSEEKSRTKLPAPSLPASGSWDSTLRLQDKFCLQDLESSASALSLLSSSQLPQFTIWYGTHVENNEV